MKIADTQEGKRLLATQQQKMPWRRWGPYLSERQWGTVREDYSTNGDAWNYFPHDVARSRTYRWGEDGIAGISDDMQRLCFALALWNGEDDILKERMFGLTNSQGNHGEDVKEYYFYLDNTPTHSYMSYLYKYPQRKFPYTNLIDENGRRKADPGSFEYELLDTGVFDEDRYFDVFVEYAKSGPEDLLIKISAANRGPETATLHVLPTIWFRNTWSWDSKASKPVLKRLEYSGMNGIVAHHTDPLFQESLADYYMYCEADAPLLFTDNETNGEIVYGLPNATTYLKDAFHAFVVHGQKDAVNPNQAGTKVAAHWRLEVPGGGRHVLRLRLYSEEEAPPRPFGDQFEHTFDARIRETEEFFADRLPPQLTEEERRAIRTPDIGLLYVMGVNGQLLMHYAALRGFEWDQYIEAMKAGERQYGPVRTGLYSRADDRS